MSWARPHTSMAAEGMTGPQPSFSSPRGDVRGSWRAAGLDFVFTPVSQAVTTTSARPRHGRVERGAAGPLSLDDRGAIYAGNV